jgi:hypothetical protein
MLFMLYKKGERDGNTQCELRYEKQNTEISVKSIQDKTIVQHRKAVNKSYSSDANFEWMFTNRCKDCNQ